MILDQTLKTLGQDYFKAGALVVGDVDYANYRTDGVNDQVELQAAINAAATTMCKVVEIVSNLNVSSALAEVVGGSVNRRIAVQLKDNVVVIIRGGVKISAFTGGNSGGSVFTSVFGNWGNLTGAKVICEGLDAFDGLSTVAGSATDRHGAVWLDARSQGCTILQDVELLINGKNTAGALVRLYNSNNAGVSVTKNITTVIQKGQGCYNDFLVERNGEGINTQLFNSTSAKQDSVVIKDGVENSTFDIKRVVSAGRYGVNISIDPTIALKFNEVSVTANVESSLDHGIYIAGMDGSLTATAFNNQKNGVFFDTVLLAATFYWPKKITLTQVVAKNNNQVGSTWSGIGGIVKNLELIAFDASDNQGSATQYRGVDFNDVKNDYIFLTSGKSESNTNSQIIVKGVNSIVGKTVIGFNRVFTVAASTAYTIAGPEDIYLVNNGSTLTFPRFSNLDPNQNPEYQVRCVTGTASITAAQEIDLSFKPIDTLAGGVAFSMTLNQTFGFLKYTDKWATKNNSSTVTDTFTNKTISTGSKLDALAGDNFTLYSQSRQAVTNSNFNDYVALSVNNPATGTQVADNWNVQAISSGVLPATLTHAITQYSAGDYTAGVIKGLNYYRLSTTGAGSGFAAGDYYAINQVIPFGTRNLCGAGRKITVNLNRYRSSIAGKKVGIFLKQNYGTGGAPSPSETLVGASFVGSTSFKDYSVTINTNTLSGKTFGAENNDNLELWIVFMWGSGATASAVGNAGVAETFLGAGTIDLSQITVQSGDVVLPFQPEPSIISTNVSVFQNSWVSYGSGYASPAYAKDSNGIVRLSGAVKLGSAVFNTIIFTLPPGFRPANEKAFLVSANAGATATIGEVHVKNSGDVSYWSGGASFLSLDNISFRANS